MIAGGKITCLADYTTCQTSTGDVLYGVVTLATQRTYKPRNKRYVTVAKIIDHSWNQKTYPINLSPAVRVIFSSTDKMDVPTLKHIGSIIKLTNFTVKSKLAFNFIRNGR